MSFKSCLVLQKSNSSSYLFRSYIPKDLRTHFGQSGFQISLNSSCLRNSWQHEKILEKWDEWRRRLWRNMRFHLICSLKSWETDRFPNWDKDMGEIFGRLWENFHQDERPMTDTDWNPWVRFLKSTWEVAKDWDRTMWVRILIFGGLFLIVVWIVTKPWRDKHNVRIEYRQLFLKLFRFGIRFISPIVVIRWIVKLIRHLKWPSLTAKISSSTAWGCPTSANLWCWWPFWRTVESHQLNLLRKTFSSMIKTRWDITSLYFNTTNEYPKLNL